MPNRAWLTTVGATVLVALITAPRTIARSQLAAGSQLAAQTHFDAASIKPAGPLVPGTPVTSLMQRGGPGTADPGRITYGRISLAALLMRAYDVQLDQIHGPDWLGNGSTNAYTVTATMPPDTTIEQFRVMLQNLLAERFQMKLHHETRDFPGYDLIVANGGSKLKVTTQDRDLAEPELAMRVGNPLQLPAGPGQSLRKGQGTYQAQFQARSVPEFAQYLGDMLHDATGENAAAPHPRIVDKTGLSAKYDFTLAFDCRGCTGLAGMSPAVRAAMPGVPEGPEAPPSGSANDPGSGLPDIFTALEKQLGLKLVKLKNVPIDVLVIDHVEKLPTGN